MRYVTQSKERIQETIQCGFWAAECGLKKAPQRRRENLMNINRQKLQA